MKIFNTMNKLCAAVVMTGGIAIGTSAQADMVYSGGIEVVHLDYADLDFDGNWEDSIDDVWDSVPSFESNILSGMTGQYGGFFASGDQYGFSLNLDSTYQIQGWEYSVNLIMTFDTATTITISSDSFWDNADFNVTGTADGSYVVEVGESFTFLQSMSVSLGEGFTTTSITFTEVPAPGAIALLGLAGIHARRRRS